MAEALMIVAYALACVVGAGVCITVTVIALSIRHEGGIRAAVNRHIARHEAEK